MSLFYRNVLFTERCFCRNAREAVRMEISGSFGKTEAYGNSLPEKEKEEKTRKEEKSMKITLKDGSSKEYQQPMSVYDIAA